MICSTPDCGMTAVYRYRYDVFVLPLCGTCLDLLCDLGDEDGAVTSMPLPQAQESTP